MTTYKNKRLLQVTAEDFKKIPGSPIAYWVSPDVRNAFSFQTIDNVSSPRRTLQTGNVPRFMRFWHEVSVANTTFSNSRASKWYAISSGGLQRKWYGNLDFVVNWENNGSEIKASGKAIIPSEDKYFQEAIGWSRISTGKLMVRYYPPGILHEDATGCLFDVNISNELLCAYLNSVIPTEFLTAINPTITTTKGSIASIPIRGDWISQEIIVHSQRCISIAHLDWNSYETSWDFQLSPLIEANQHNQTPGTILGAYLRLRFGWQTQCEEMHRLEVENNRIFIEAYGLQDELSPEVPWNEITLTCNPWYRYGKAPTLTEDGQWIIDSGDCHVGDVWGVGQQGTIHVSFPNGRIPASKMPFNQELETRLLQDTIKELLSYAVGCMFGRYSLDVDGLVYAGGEWDASKYTTFPADRDNVIPICDDEYFEDDLTGRFVKFIETVYGTETLEENLTFIANALGGRGSAREVIRRYFRNDFFADHCKMYQKRPIYWLFDSGKKGGFRALIYMHRYQPSMLATLRTDYVHEQQERYRTAIADLAQRVDNASGSEKVKLTKQLAALREQAEETRIYEEKIHHLADQMISIDLDDGEKHNYAIFQDVLAKIK